MAVALKRIAVSGFKSIREMDLELRSLNVLIGANGAGKSNFISIFRLLNEIIENRLADYSVRVGADTLLYFGLQVTDRIDLELDFGEYRYFATLVPASANSLVFVNENTYYLNAAERQFSGMNLKEAHSETMLYDEEYINETPKPLVDNILRVLKGCKVYHFHDVSREARIKQIGDLHDNRYLRPDGANLAAFLYLLQERYRPYYDRIVQSVRLIAPFFDSFMLAPLLLTPSETIRLEWRERGSDDYFNAHALSDGTLRFICLTTLLLQPEPPSLILIDEPELGLHPYALNYLAGMIRSVSTDTQIIVSTQSAALVDQFEPEDVIVVDRENRQSVFKRQSSDELAGWLEDYRLGELWEKNVLGGHRQSQEP